MEYRILGSSDLKVSALALGTMTFGQQNSEADAHAQLDLAVSHGINFIDTAEMYPVPPNAETVHRTESYVGTWLRRQQRDKLIVATKITGPARGFSWIRNTPRINREHLTAAIDGSLRRLQTDYVDLYQLHWPDRYVPMFGEPATTPVRNVTARPSPSNCKYWRNWSGLEKFATSAFPTRRRGAYPNLCAAPNNWDCPGSSAYKMPTTC